MKQCPVCEKEFDDSLRFCQVDGTPLVDKTEEEELDPFKTMVASKAEILAAMPPAKAEPPPPEPSVPAPIENELLEIPPAVDPNKTQFVSEAELRAEMAAHQAEEQVIDVPPLAEPEPPKFAIPEPVIAEPETPLVVEPEVPSAPISEQTPPSPFATPENSEPPQFSKTSPPIPSPFGETPLDIAIREGKEAEESIETPASEVVDPAVNPFEPALAAPIAQAEVSSPVVPESNMQNPQNFGQNAPASGPSQTLAIVSLVLGILGLTLCCGTFIIPLVAVITGFMARGKANNDPANYGGAGLALGGLITGALGLVGGIILWIVYVFYFAAIMASMPR